MTTAAPDLRVGGTSPAMCRRKGSPWGFQITFFRSRVDGTQQLQSAFAAKHLLFAHAAITDVRGQRLVHDQRIARVGFGVAQL